MVERPFPPYLRSSATSADNLFLFHPRSRCSGAEDPGFLSADGRRFPQMVERPFPPYLRSSATSADNLFLFHPRSRCSGAEAPGFLSADGADFRRWLKGLFLPICVHQRHLRITRSCLIRGLSRLGVCIPIVGCRS